MRLGVPLLVRHTVVRALGQHSVEGAQIAQIDPRGKILEGTIRDVDVDTVCLAVGLRPNARLAAMAGCRLAFSARLGGWVPVHDASMRTTVDGIYVAGDVAGIEEASIALEEGRLAGLFASADVGQKRDGDAKAVREIQMRLSDLRGGPFGAGLSAAKEEVHAKKAGGK
jgi:sarcosine oxidase subunit alpha